MTLIRDFRPFRKPSNCAATRSKVDICTPVRLVALAMCFLAGQVLSPSVIAQQSSGQKSSAVWERLFGNWDITYELPGGKKQRGHAVVSPDPSGRPHLHGVIYERQSGAQRDENFSLGFGPGTHELLGFDGSTFESRGFHFPASFRLTLSADANTLSGPIAVPWNEGRRGMAGREVWTRVRPKVARAYVVSPVSSEALLRAWARHEPLAVRFAIEGDQLPRRYWRRATQPRTLDGVAGDDLARLAFFDTALAPTGPPEGDNRGERIEVNLLIFPGARSGSRWLVLNGVPFEFELRLPAVVPPPLPIPPDDQDLERVLARLRSFETLARECATSDCPKLDCQQAQDLIIRLRDAREHMRYLYFWLSRAADGAAAHFRSIAQQSIANTERVRKLRAILAWQQAVHKGSSVVLDAFSISGSLDALTKNPKILDTASSAFVIEQLNELHDAATDLESLRKQWDETLATAISDFGPRQKQIVLGVEFSFGDLKGATSDLKSAIQAAVKGGRDWRKILSEGGAVSILQIVGLAAKNYGDQEISARQQLANSLLRDIVAEDKVQAQVYTNMRRIQDRRDVAERAYRSLDKLVVVRDDSASMTRCFIKLELHLKCRPFDLGYLSKRAVPVEVRVSVTAPTKSDLEKPSGKALRILNAMLPEVERWLTPPQSGLCQHGSK